MRASRGYYSGLALRCDLAGAVLGHERDQLRCLHNNSGARFACVESVWREVPEQGAPAKGSLPPRPTVVRYRRR